MLTTIFRYLNDNTTYAVLRNYQDLPHGNKGRDIDIMIKKKDFYNHKQELLNILVENNYRIVTLYKSDKMFAIMCVNYAKEVVHFDFLFNTSLRGVLFLEANDVLNDRVFNGCIYHVSREYEFLDKYLYNKSLGYKYPEKYSALKNEILATDNINQIIKAKTWFKTFDKLDSANKFTYLFKVLLRQLVTNPINQSKQIILFVAFQLKNTFIHSGVSISFTGADGVGKTTIINDVIYTFSQTTQVDLYHHRPTLFGNISDVANKAGLKKEVDKDYNNPHRGSKKGLFSSFFRLIYYSIDYILGYAFNIKRKLYQRHIVIFDRYFTDVIVDSRRSSIYLNTKFLYYWGKLFIPKMKYNFLVTADPDIILSRKQELDREGIARINTKMEYLASKKDYYMVMNNGTAEEAVDKILSIVINEQHKHNLKRV